MEYSGVLMSRRILYFSLLSLSLSACSGLDNKRAVGNFDYANVSEAKELVVPEGMHAPAKHEKFSISHKINYDGPIGPDMDVRAPSLVLPVAASSRVIPDSQQALIWFDQVLDDKDLLAYIVTAIKQQLASDEVELNLVEQSNNLYESTWFHHEVESGVYFTSVELSESMRFRYQLARKPHGRSVSLLVNLVDYMKTDSKGSTKTINPVDKIRAEMAMINEIIAQVDYMYRLQKRENHLLRANKKILVIGENVEAEPAYIVDMPLDSLWSNLPVFFEGYGFKVTDLNESKHIYFVDFTQPETSFWSNLWGEEKPVLALANGKYQFVLAKMADKTALTIYDELGNVLSNEVLEQAVTVMEPALSFKELY